MLLKRAKYLSILLSLILFSSCKKDKKNDPGTDTKPENPSVTASWTETNYNGQPVSHIFRNNSDFFLSSDRLYYSGDSGAYWYAVNQSPVPCLAANGATLFAGGTIQSTAAVWISTNSGAAWTLKTDSNFAGIYVRCLAANNNTIYAGAHSGAYVSVNNGENWIAINGGLPPYSNIRAFLQKDTNLFAGTLGVYRLNKQTSTWMSASNGLPSDAIVNCLGVCGNYIIAGTSNGKGIFISNTNGSTWTEANQGLPNYGSYPDANSIVVAGQHIFAVMDDHVFVSTNNGANWAVLTGLPGGNSVNSVMVHNNILYAAGSVGTIPPYGKIWKCALSSIH